jgi:hypothetical protein
MIDTIRFKIPLSDEQFLALQKRSVEVKSHDHETDRVNFCIYKVNKSIGSYDRKINIFLSDDGSCYLEFSLPKFVFGHNIYLVSPEKLEYYLDEVANEINKKIAPFPYPIFWEYERIDFCYAWQFLDDRACKSDIDIIQNIKYPRRSTYHYGTSCMFVGDSDTVKFYMKHPEFHAHDFVELKKTGHTEVAFNLLNRANGILRFEVSVRKRELKRIFHIWKDEPVFLTKRLTREKIYSILNKYLNNLMKLKTEETVNKEQAAFKLLSVYKPAKASRMYQFMLGYYSTTATDKKMVEGLSRAVISYNLKQLKHAHIGFFTNEEGTVPLCIPSDYEVREVSDTCDSTVALPGLVTHGKRQNFLTISL